MNRPLTHSKKRITIHPQLVGIIIHNFDIAQLGNDNQERTALIWIAEKEKRSFLSQSPNDEHPFGESLLCRY